MMKYVGLKFIPWGTYQTMAVRVFQAEGGFAVTQPVRLIVCDRSKYPPHQGMRECARRRG